MVLTLARGIEQLLEYTTHRNSGAKPWVPKERLASNSFVDGSPHKSDILTLTLKP